MVYENSDTRIIFVVINRQPRKTHQLTTNYIRLQMEEGVARDGLEINDL